LTVITRIPIANLYYLLCYAWNRLEDDELVDVGQLEGTDSVNLLAQLLTALARQALRRGLNRDYLGRREDVACLRGRVLLAESSRRLLLQHGRAACEFDELDHNNLPNQILLATLLNLRDADSISADNRDALSALIRELRTIEPADLQSGLFRRVRLHRSNAHYGLLLAVCELAYDCVMPEPGAGPHRLRGFVEDHRLLAKVYENFVHNFYAAHAPDHGYAGVGAPKVKWAAVPADPASAALLPSMNTDVVLRGAERRIIIDCKFHHEALAGRFERDTLISANLYQIFTYVKNQRHAAGWEKCEGLLLYPAVADDFVADYDMDGNRIRAATLDLAQSCDQIRDRLLWLITS
jgi:5-methylcytosine-specific restriction enzyme subunit McrC